MCVLDTETLDRPQNLIPAHYTTRSLDTHHRHYFKLYKPMSLRLFTLYYTHVFEILHFSENVFLLLHSRSNIRGSRTVQRPDFYLCLSSVCTCVTGYRGARATNSSTCKQHIGILNGRRHVDKSRNAESLDVKDEITQLPVQDPSSNLVTNMHCRVQIYDFVLLRYLLFNSLSQFKITDTVQIRGQIA